MSHNIPVVTIDGPSGSGKGTISSLLAKKLQWHFLDSGSLYRLVALAAVSHTIDLGDEQRLSKLALNLDIKFMTTAKNSFATIFLENQDVTEKIRTEEIGASASKVASLQGVRDALVAKQQAFRQPPGLVADGRDMGTIIFPDAIVKIFLNASAKERAQRRYNQLKAIGINVSLDRLFAEISARDERDMNRAVAPLLPAKEAIMIDTTNLGIVEVFEHVWQAVSKKVC